MVYVIRVNPQGHPDPERGPVGPLLLGEAIRRARQAPDPHSGWRNIAVAEVTASARPAETSPIKAAIGMDDRELLQQAADALWDCVKASLTVKPNLDTPYDAPYQEWTPYTRWVERPASRAHDLAVKIRKRLREAP